MLRTLERDRWLAIALMGGLAGLLLVVVRNFGLGLPPFPENSRSDEPPISIPAAARLSELFDIATVPALTTSAREASPFYTTHFQPPPQPKPPTTRQIPMTYLGHIQGADGQRRAFVRVDNQTFIREVSQPVVDDLMVAEIALQTLTLTNSAAQTNVLQFQTEQRVEVPIK